MVRLSLTFTFPTALLVSRRASDTRARGKIVLRHPERLELWSEVRCHGPRGLARLYLRVANHFQGTHNSAYFQEIPAYA